MPVSPQDTVFRHVGNGVTTTFSFGCQVPQPNDLQVFVNNARAISGFSVAGIGALTGGTVTFTQAPASGIPVRIERVIALERSTDYQQNGDFLARVVNPDFNRIWMALQGIFGKSGRSLRIPDSDTSEPSPIPSAADRANKLLSFDAEGNPIAVVPSEQSAAAVLIALASGVGSSLIGYTHGAVGTVRRWLHDRLNDSVSSKDFGAKGDFNLATDSGTDDTDAIQRALVWCSANQKRLKQVGLSKITRPLDWSNIGQVSVIGDGAPRTFDSGWVYKGTGIMVEGAGQDKALYFSSFENMLFEGPGEDSGVDGFYGDFYHGGTDGCLFRGWRYCARSFGTLNTFKRTRFLSCVDGIRVTNWPAGTTQAGVGTTTFLSEGNNYYGCTGIGLNIDTSSTGAANIVSSASRNDTFEQNGQHLLVNKSFDFILDNPHFEFASSPTSVEFVNSIPTIISPYIHPGDISKFKFTDTFSPPNSTGHNQIDSNGISTRQLTLVTHELEPASLSATDSGGIALSGADVVGSWTPTIGSTGGTSSGNVYSSQQGHFQRLGNMFMLTFRVVLSEKDAGMSGALTIGGLPFLADGLRSNTNGNILRLAGVTLSGGSGNYTHVVCDLAGQLAYPVKISPTGLAPVNLDPSEISGTAVISGTLIGWAA